MTDYYLKADSRSSLLRSLKNAGLRVDGVMVPGAYLDEIGFPEGETAYLANLRLEDGVGDPSLLLTTPEPETPLREWFDIPTPPEMTDEMRDQSRA